MFWKNKNSVRKSKKPIDIIKADHPTIVVNPVQEDDWHHQIRLIEYANGTFRTQESLSLGSDTVHYEPSTTRYTSKAEAKKAADGMRIVGVHKV